MTRGCAVEETVLPDIAEAYGTRNSAEELNVLLIGPFYGQDANFTNQHPNEAASIAEATGGSCTILSTSNATGPNIAAAMPEAGRFLMPGDESIHQLAKPFKERFDFAAFGAP